MTVEPLSGIYQHPHSPISTLPASKIPGHITRGCTWETASIGWPESSRQLPIPVGCNLYDLASLPLTPSFCGCPFVQDPKPYTRGELHLAHQIPGFVLRKTFACAVFPLLPPAVCRAASSPYLRFSHKSHHSTESLLDPLELYSHPMASYP